MANDPTRRCNGFALAELPHLKDMEIAEMVSFIEHARTGNPGLNELEDETYCLAEIARVSTPPAPKIAEAFVFLRKLDRNAGEGTPISSHRLMQMAIAGVGVPPLQLYNDPKDPGAPGLPAAQQRFLGRLVRLLTAIDPLADPAPVIEIGRRLLKGFEQWHYRWKSKTVVSGNPFEQFAPPL